MSDSMAACGRLFHFNHPCLASRLVARRCGVRRGERSTGPFADPGSPRSEKHMNGYSTTLQNITLRGAQAVRDKAMASAQQLGFAISIFVVDLKGVVILAE